MLFVLIILKLSKCCSNSRAWYNDRRVLFAMIKMIYKKLIKKLFSIKSDYSHVFILFLFNSLNFITSHSCLHDYPLIMLKNILDKSNKYNKSLKRLISCAFFLSYISLIIIIIHSFIIFINYSLLLILHAKYNMIWHIIMILKFDSYQRWLY